MIDAVFHDDDFCAHSSNADGTAGIQEILARLPVEWRIDKWYVRKSKYLSYS